MEEHLITVKCNFETKFLAVFRTFLHKRCSVPFTPEKYSVENRENVHFFRETRETCSYEKESLIGSQSTQISERGKAL